MAREEHLDAYRADGFAVLDVLEGRDGEAVSAAARRCFAEPSRADDKGLSFRGFPFRDQVLNDLALDERLLDFAAATFDGEAVFCTQIFLRATHPSPGSADQELHRDYTDNTILHPSDDPRFGQLAVLAYLTDVALDQAPTHVCPRSVSDDRPALPRARSRDLDPDLYEHERPVTGPAGTALAYSMATFHRGSRFLAADGRRIVLHLNFRPAGCEWMSMIAFAQSFESGEAAARCMTELSVRQRSALGVPPPGHPYWTSTTIDGVQARYPAMDLEPYRACL